MSAALARVRALCANLDVEVAGLAGELLTACRSARDILEPVVEAPGVAGVAANVAFQLLTDAIASAEPPLSLPQQPPETP